MRDFCWKNNFYANYQSVFGILNLCEKKGYVDVKSKSDKVPVTGVVLNVHHIINWKMCCKQLGD